MQDCIFCKIINNEIPSVTLYEDDDVKAFLDISQATPGHTLVVPKKHVADMFEYDEELASKVFSRIPKIARAIKAFDPNIQGMNIVNNNGEVAYQTVFHSHIHLIPRYSTKDGFNMTFADNSSNYEPSDLEEIAQKISQNIED